MTSANAGFPADLIVAALTQLGYGGVILLMAAESACVPLPSEIILPFAGYLVFRGRMNLLAVATAGAAGCNLGSLVAYEIARGGGRAAVERWGRFVLLTPERLRLAERFFARRGEATVFVGRMLPMVRTFIAAPAGLAGMPRLRFHLYTFAGSWPWCLLLAWLGWAGGRRWGNSPALQFVLDAANALLAGAVALAIGGFVWSRVRARRSDDEPHRRD